MRLNSSVVVLIMTLNLSGANMGLISCVWLLFALPRLIFFWASDSAIDLLLRLSID